MRRNWATPNNALRKGSTRVPSLLVPSGNSIRLSPVLSLRIHVKGALSSQRPLLVASNHISWTDIMVLGSFADVTFIARADMEGWPLIGWLSKLQRTVFIERERKRTAGDQASEIASRMAKGDAMVLFAEGSTGDGNIVLPFKSTLFGAASMAISEGAAEQVFIQPVAIAYTRLDGIPLGRYWRPLFAWFGDLDLVPHLWQMVCLGETEAVVTFFPPINIDQLGDRKKLAEFCFRQVSLGVQAANCGRDELLPKLA